MPLAHACRVAGESKLRAEFLRRKVAEYEVLQTEMDELKSEIGEESLSLA